MQRGSREKGCADQGKQHTAALCIRFLCPPSFLKPSLEPKPLTTQISNTQKLTDMLHVIPTPSDLCNSNRCNSNRYLSLRALERRGWEDSLEQESFGKHCKQDGKPSQDSEHRQAARGSFSRVKGLPSSGAEETQLYSHPQSNAPSGRWDKGSREQSHGRACQFPYGNSVTPTREKVSLISDLVRVGDPGDSPRPSPTVGEGWTCISPLPTGWGKAFGNTHVAYFSVGRG